MGRVRRSLGARILLLAALNLAMLAAIGAAASGVRLPRSLRDAVMQSAEPRLQDLVRRIALDLERTPREGGTALLDRYAAEFNTRLMLVLNDGTRVAGAPFRLPPEVADVLAGPPPGERRPSRKLPGVGPPEGPTGLRLPQTPAVLITVRGGPTTWIVLRTPIRFAGETDITPGSLIVIPYAFLNDSLLFPVQWLWWAMAALAVTVACWWPFLRGVTTSVSSMERATDRIASGRFDTTIGIARADELGRLSSAIERMASRLGALVTGQKRFLGDTAHELRSPLGRMQLALEILNTRVGDSERPYVRDLKEDVDALSALTDDLLQYARAELTEQPIQTTRVDVSEAIDRVVARESNGAQFDVQVPRGLHAIADAKLLERALANVCRNAATYAGAAGPIEVRAARDGGSIAVTVSDRGPGVAPESLTRIFEPFFREDRARNRKTGGTGLGLAITRSAVEACGGTVGTELRQPHGLTVRLAFPASTAAPSSSPQTAPGGRSAMR